MPELPDVVVYIEALASRVAGRRLEGIRLLSPFVLRSVDPPIDALRGEAVRNVRRIGKRIVLEFDHELFLVIHLMIAGRLRWREPGQKPGVGGRIVLAAFEFEHGTLLFTEAGSKKRASLPVDISLDHNLSNVFADGQRHGHRVDHEAEIRVSALEPETE